MLSIHPSKWQASILWCLGMGSAFLPISLLKMYQSGVVCYFFVPGNDKPQPKNHFLNWPTIVCFSKYPCSRTSRPNESMLGCHMNFFVAKWYGRNKVITQRYIVIYDVVLALVASSPWLSERSHRWRFLVENIRTHSCICWRRNFWLRRFSEAFFHPSKCFVYR